jgi:hypothetical protein
MTLWLAESTLLSLKFPTTMASTCRILRSSSGVALAPPDFRCAPARPAARLSIAHQLLFPEARG